jgi:hypothetical protein
LYCPFGTSFDDVAAVSFITYRRLRLASVDLESIGDRARIEELNRGDIPQTLDPIK